MAIAHMTLGSGELKMLSKWQPFNHYHLLKKLFHLHKPFITTKYKLIISNHLQATDGNIHFIITLPLAPLHFVITLSLQPLHLIIILPL